MDEIVRLGELLASPTDLPADDVRARAHATLETAMSSTPTPLSPRRPLLVVATAAGLGAVALAMALLLLLRDPGPNGGLSPVSGPPEVDILDASPYTGPLPERLEREFRRLEGDGFRIDRSTIRGNWRLDGSEATVAAFAVEIRNLRNDPGLDTVDDWVFILADSREAGIDGLVGFVGRKSFPKELACDSDGNELRMCSGVDDTYVFRVPQGTAEVVEMNADGTTHRAAVGHGLALTWNPRKAFPPEAIESRGRSNEAIGWYRPLTGRWTAGAYRRTPGSTELFDRFSILSRPRAEKDIVDPTQSRESLETWRHGDYSSSRLAREIVTPTTRIEGRNRTTFRYFLLRGAAEGNICLNRHELGLVIDQRECFALGDAVVGDSYYVTEGLEGYGGDDVVTGLVPDGVESVEIDGTQVEVVGNLYVHRLPPGIPTVVFESDGVRHQVVIDRRRAPVSL